MKIFKVSREEYSRDEYDSFVAVADNKEEVITFHPSGKNNLQQTVDWSTKDLIVEELGEVTGAKKGIILSSFNAG